MDENNFNLILKAQKNDKISLEKLIKSSIPNIKATLFYLKKNDINNNYDINDLTQEILVKLSKKINQLKNPKYYKTWLNQIIINCYYDYLRKNKKQNNIINIESKEENKTLDIVDYASNPQENILNSELDFIIKTSIQNLPLHYKIPITLREIQGLSYEEISNITKK